MTEESSTAYLLQSSSAALIPCESSTNSPLPSSSGFSDSSMLLSSASSSSSGRLCKVITFPPPDFGGRCLMEWITPPGKSPFWSIGTFFFMSAAFSSARPNECKCCQYRQYIRGYFATRWDSSDPWEYRDKELTPGVFLHKTIYREDGDGTTPFGHRDGENRPDDKYLPTRKTGCSYSAADRPAIRAYPLQYYDLHLKFIGKIIDTCAPNSPTVIEHQWDVICNGRAPLHL